MHRPRACGRGQEPGRKGGAGQPVAAMRQTAKHCRWQSEFLATPHPAHPRHAQPTWLSARNACWEYQVSPDTSLSACCPRSLNAFFSWTCRGRGEERGQPGGGVARRSQSDQRARQVDRVGDSQALTGWGIRRQHTQQPTSQHSTSQSTAQSTHLEVPGVWEGYAHNDDAPRIAVGKVQPLRHLQWAGWWLGARGSSQGTRQAAEH